MKLWQIVGGAAALTLTLAGCAQKSGNVPTPTAGSAAIAQTQIQGPAVTGSVNIRQRIALPPDAILPVTQRRGSLFPLPVRNPHRRRQGNCSPPVRPWPGHV